MEALQEILSENPKGVLVLRDELVGLLQSWEREGRESDRAFYLSGWSAGEAGGSYESDRIGRGNVTATPCLSLLGSIQPAKLEAYVRGTVGRGSQADGLLRSPSSSGPIRRT